MIRRPAKLCLDHPWALLPGPYKKQQLDENRLQLISLFIEMASKKIFVVFGATGNQGGSVINAVLADSKTASEFQIRGITRDPSKPNAKALEARGVECVAADIDNKEQIKSAFQGAYAVFAMTNYWEKMDAELEMQQGRNIADLAKVCIPAIEDRLGGTGNSSVVNGYMLNSSGIRCPTPHLVFSHRCYQAVQRQVRKS